MFDECSRRAILTTFAGIAVYFILTEACSGIGRALSDALYPNDIEMKTSFAGVGKVVGFGVFVAGAIALLLRSRKS